MCRWEISRVLKLDSDVTSNKANGYAMPGKTGSHHITKENLLNNALYIVHASQNIRNVDFSGDKTERKKRKTTWIFLLLFRITRFPISSILQDTQNGDQLWTYPLEWQYREHPLHVQGEFPSRQPDCWSAYSSLCRQLRRLPRRLCHVFCKKGKEKMRSIYVSQSLSVS